MKFRMNAMSMACTLVSLALASGATGLAQDTFQVTIQNLTRGQLITPPLVVVHDGSTSLFSVGQPASAELATLAEEGNPTPLMEAAMGMEGVFDAAVAFGPGDPPVIPPGQSASVMVEGTFKYRWLSVVGMLATTNDSFFAVSGVQLPARLALYFLGPRSMTLNAPAYDAGSEANSESCDYIPGPPCGNHVHDPAEPEGFVHISNGIQGIGDINAAAGDWRNPVARVTITRVD